MEPPDNSLTGGTECVRIPTRTERRALDWSLVLASQQISSVIENQPESGWALLVSPAEHTRAREIIELYLRENRRWPWQRTVLKQEIIFDWAATLWLILTMVVYQLQRTSASVRDAGVLDTVAVSRGEWWRCFTAELLHADLLHLATNSVFGMILLGLAMGRFGTGLGLLAAYLAGTVGNILSWLAEPRAHHSLGASGVVMGALGLLAAQSLGAFRFDRRGWKLALSGMAAGVMLFVLLGLNPGTDVAAHLGGFIAGNVFGFGLVSIRSWSHKPFTNLLAVILFVVLVAWPWLLAIHSWRQR